MNNRLPSVLFVLALIPLPRAFSARCHESPDAQGKTRGARDPSAGPALGTSTSSAIDDRIARGRAMLEVGDVRAAQAFFDEAAAIDGATPRSRVWVVRGWIAQGHLDEALQASDELGSAGATRDSDYVLGLALFAKAKTAIENGAAGAYTESEIEDAVRLLRGATAADPERFFDAFLPLSEAAWYAQDLELARAAVDRALLLAPAEPEGHLLRGQVALSQHVALRETSEEEAERHRRDAIQSFERAAALLGEPRDPRSQRALAEACVQLGNAHAWNGESERASAAYARAMAWDPAVVDFARALEQLGDEAFAAEVARARREFAKHHAARDRGAAMLAWWQGYASFRLAEWSAAERAFQDALEAHPGYTNSWYYLFRSRFSGQDYVGALAALHQQEDADASGLDAALAAERDMNVPILRFLEAWCADLERNAGGATVLDAAFVSGLLTRVQPEEPQFWNNLGLFLRDAGEQMKGVDPEEARALWERAWLAYVRALELAPEHPAYLNDTAVMLHYYLERDFLRARELYQEAGRRAGETLARTDVAPDVRAWMEIARRDSEDNLRKLERLLRRRETTRTGDE